MNKERTRIQRVYRVFDESDYPYVGDSNRKEFQVDFRGQKLFINRIQTNVSDWDSMDAPKYSYNIVSDNIIFEKYHPQVPEILEFLKKKDFSTFKFDNGGRVYNDQELLEKYRKKQKIGFSTKSHLKAKGLIPRSDGSQTPPYVSDDFQIGYDGAYEHLLAPNGKPSNLTPEQYRLVRTPAFKEWFGDWENNPSEASKIVDKNGEPLVVYHGTTRKFNEFIAPNYFSSSKPRTKGGKNFIRKWIFFFTPNREIAKDYATDITLSKKDGIIIPVFVNARKLLVIDAQNNLWEEYTDIILKEYNQKINNAVLIKNVEDNFMENRKITDVYAVFDDLPKELKIKLADGSNTTFDGSNPDIRFASGGEIKIGDNLFKIKVYLGDHSYDPKTQKETPMWFARVYEMNGKTVDGILTEDGDLEGSDISPFETKTKANDFIRYYGHKLNVILFDDRGDKFELFINPDIRFADGGSLKKKWGSVGDMTKAEIREFYNSAEGKELDKQTYKKWKSLVNMSKGELEAFYNSQEGKDAGLSPSEAKEKGIDSGRESARWIMKMKDIPYSEWTPTMWKWAKKQISFISRMSGNKGGLYDDKGNKTRKHTSLLIWGHNPEKIKYANGGVVKFYNKDNEHRLSRPSGSIEKELLDKVRYDSIKQDFVGSFGWKTIYNKLGDGYLYKLDDYDQDLMKNIALRPAERIYRYINRTTAIGGISPLIKMNIEKGLLYFPIYNEADDIIFETRGVKALWINLIEDKYADGGGVGSDKWQIQNSAGRYYSVSMQSGNPVFNESPDLGYSFKKEEAESIKNKLIESGLTDLTIVEYNPNWWKAENGIKFDHGGSLNYLDNMESQNLSGQNMPGGYLVGNSHAEGGIKIKTPEGMIEAEGGETIINKRSMASDEVLVCEGTPKEIASKVNEYGDGVQFAEGGNCRVVSTGETVSSSTTTMDNNMAENGMQVTAAEGMRVASEMKKYTITSLYNSDISWQANENDLRRYVIESMDEFDFKPGESLIESMNKMGFSVSTNVYFPDSAAEMAARGTIVRSNDASVRPSPSISATIFDAGTRMTGNDGNTWEIAEDSRGVHRWKRVKMKDGGMMMAADGIQTKPVQKEICFMIDTESDGSQLWVFIVNNDMDVNFRIDYENRDYDYDVPHWDYRSESTYFNTKTDNADFAYGFEMLEVFDKDGDPIEVSDEMKDELNKQIENVYKSYFKDETKDDIPLSIKGNIKFEDGGPVNEFTMNVKNSLDALMKYFAEHHNKIHVHGSDYEYNSQTPMYLRVTGGKGATYNIVPFFSKIGSGIYEGAMYYSLVRAAVKKDFALLQSGKLMDLAEDGMEVKADKGLLTGSLGTPNERRFQRELEMLRDDVKDEVITMDEYYQQRNELYNKYGIGKFAVGGNIDSEKIYIEFLNKRKNYQKDKRYFKTYEDAMNWGRKNLENFHPDMVKIQYADGGDIEKANLGYLLVAEKIKGIAPKSFDAADEKVAERIKSSEQYADGGEVDDKKVIAFAKSLEKSGLMAKGSHTNKRAIDTINSIISMSRKDFDKYITENPNRNVNIIYNEYQDWVQTYADGGDVKKKLNEPPSRVSGQKIVVFKKKVNPQVTITVKTYPNGQITDIENEYEVRFPYSVGQILNMGHRTWACSNGYMVNDQDPCGEEKIFGIRTKDIPLGHEFRHLYPNKFRR